MKFKFFQYFYVAAFIFFKVFQANAACSSPAGSLGSIKFISNQFMFCDNTNWVALGSSSSPSFPLQAPNGLTIAPTYSFSNYPGMGMYYASGVTFTANGISNAIRFSTTGETIFGTGVSNSSGFQVLGGPLTFDQPSGGALRFNSIVDTYNGAFNGFIDLKGPASAPTQNIFLTLPTSLPPTPSFIGADGSGAMGYSYVLGAGWNVSSISSSGTITSTHYSFYILTSSGVYQLPSAASLSDGIMIGLKNLSNVTTVIRTNGSETIDNISGRFFLDNFQEVILVASSGNWLIQNGSLTPTGSCTSVSGSYSAGNTYSLTVNSTGCTCSIVLRGGKGGNGEGFGAGGAGGALQFSYNPTATGNFSILVGSQGSLGATTPTYGGGAPSRSNCAYQAGSGGGASSILYNSVLLAIAGGGGGAHYSFPGGAGGSGGIAESGTGDFGFTGFGGSVSSTATSPIGAALAGAGSSTGGANAGGAGGLPGSNGNSGGTSTWVTAGGTGNSTYSIGGGGGAGAPANTYCSGSGGGGYGGGGGGYNTSTTTGGGGGGGGGFINMTLVTSLNQSTNNGDGQVIINCY